ncbi:HPP family protein [Paracoccus sulfuroxidans]|uniref:CBS domain-containing membrane protein n=1 Tax=Paracoccus sulfuroxidans TaxID=384678 RepID=A0A562NUC8_9RHOB|nr:HPP family protein [Paracoccus sulfuroxidans]TWI35837.1 CBS domain-containing membrane protein [Paracoccus sulfuroxidans]
MTASPHPHGSRLRRFLHALGPAMHRPRGAEPFRAGLGAGLGLLAVGLLLAHARMLGGSSLQQALLVAPMGATAFLLFSIPNSPLAQPWSAIVGNTSAALVALTVMLVPMPPPVSIALAVGLAICVMGLTRSLHPPGAAVALATVLEVQHAGHPGYVFALSPILLDTALLVLMAVIWNRATGRKYPFRQPPEPSSETDAASSLSTEDLEDILDRFRQSPNIGPADLRRILVAAEEEAARRIYGAVTAGQVMTRDPVAVRVGTRLSVLADLFRKHDFKTVPVVGAQGRLRGLISQNDLIQRARDHATSHHNSFAAAMGALARATVRGSMRAGDIMRRDPKAVAPSTPIGELIPMLADQGLQAVPVVQDERLVGIVTRSDMMRVLAQGLTLRPLIAGEALTRSPDPAPPDPRPSS